MNLNFIAFPYVAVPESQLALHDCKWRAQVSIVRLRPSKNRVGFLSTLKMHEDHRDWRSKHAMWVDDIEIWQKQLQGAMVHANELVQMIGKQVEELAAQSARIEEQETKLQEHEHHLATSKHFGMEKREWRTINHVELAKQIEIM